MVGNACEWVDGWGHSPEEGTSLARVAKGGGFTSRAAALVSWSRTFCRPADGNSQIGFRCVMDFDNGEA